MNLSEQLEFTNAVRELLERIVKVLEDGAADKAPGWHVAGHIEVTPPEPIERIAVALEAIAEVYADPTVFHRYPEKGDD